MRVRVRVRVDGGARQAGCWDGSNGSDFATLPAYAGLCTVSDMRSPGLLTGLLDDTGDYHDHEAGEAPDGADCAQIARLQCQGVHCIFTVEGGGGFPAHLQWDPPVFSTVAQRGSSVGGAVQVGAVCTVERRQCAVVAVGVVRGCGRSPTKTRLLLDNQPTKVKGPPSVCRLCANGTMNSLPRGW